MTNSCKYEHIVGITLWRETAQPQSAQLFWAISILDANVGLLFGLSKNREISICVASPEPAVSLLPALVVTFSGWWICRVVQGVMKWHALYAGQTLSVFRATIPSELFSVVPTERLWVTMEEMGCLTDSQWAARLFPDCRNTVRLDLSHCSFSTCSSRGFNTFTALLFCWVTTTKILNLLKLSASAVTICQVTAEEASRFHCK